MVNLTVSTPADDAADIVNAAGIGIQAVVRISIYDDAVAVTCDTAGIYSFSAGNCQINRRV
ncbi:hypothetical protein D3C73_1045060 [compost metagenome]